MYSRKARIIYILIVLYLILYVFTACSKSDDSKVNTNTTHTVRNTPTELNSPTPTPKENSMFAINPLTGLYDMEKDNVGKRPLAITINNIKKATPQHGISSADLYYEVVAEGGITRILALFSDVDKMPEQVGPVRSARHYYVDLALGHDAIFTHYGGSYIAREKIKNEKIDDIDGMYISSVFWRDPVLKEERGTEHSVLTSGEKLWDYINKKKYRVDSNIKNSTCFKFLDDDNVVTPNSRKAQEVDVPFSRYVTASFKYDVETKLYYKSQFDAPHKDMINDKQISVTNVFVLFTNIKVIDNNNGLVDVDLSKGDGYYISAGGAMPIKWSKGSTNDPLVFKDNDGNELQINSGKSYICFIDKSRESLVKIK